MTRGGRRWAAYWALIKEVLVDKPVGKWRLGFYLNERLEVLAATIDARQEGFEYREIVRMATGPFDTPDDILATFLELVEEAEWKGEQLRLPTPL
jgi:hypothetical protein